MNSKPKWTALAAVVAATVAFGPVAAQETAAGDGAPATDEDVFDIIVPADDTTLEDWRWLKRPVVIFADSPADPRYVQQMQYVTDRLGALDERDVIVITDSDPAARSSVRRELRPRGFMLVVMAKDGTIVTRKPRPWSVREISRSIDKLPLRQQEVRDRAAAGS